jgi:hypothetical protein
MRVRVTFRLLSQEQTDDRASFWEEYRRLARIEDDDDIGGRHGPSRRADEMEGYIRGGFAAHINRSIGEHFGVDRYWERFPGKRSGDAPGANPFKYLTLTVARIDYGSLHVLLDVFGLDNESLLPLVAAALEVYAPQAMNNAMPGRSVPMAAIAAAEDGGPPLMPTTSSANLPVTPDDSVALTSAKERAAQRLWQIVNSTLLVPVILALAVLYIFGTMFAEAVKHSQADGRALQQQSADLIKVISEQNATLARTLTQVSGDISRVMKDVQQQQIESVKAKPPSTPASPQPSTSAAKGTCLLAVWCGW